MNNVPYIKKKEKTKNSLINYTLVLTKNTLATKTNSNI